MEAIRVVPMAIVPRGNSMTIVHTRHPISPPPSRKHPIKLSCHLPHLPPPILPRGRESARLLRWLSDPRLTPVELLTIQAGSRRSLFLQLAGPTTARFLLA